MDTNVVLTIVGALLAVVSGLIMLQLKSIKVSSDRLEDAVTKRLDKQDSVIEKIKDALGELKDTIRDRQDVDRGALIQQIETAEAGLHAFQTKVLSNNVTKTECQQVISDLKQRIFALEESLKEVDAVTREQSMILARIDQAVRSL